METVSNVSEGEVEAEQVRSVRAVPPETSREEISKGKNKDGESSGFHVPKQTHMAASNITGEFEVRTGVKKKNNYDDKLYDDFDMKLGFGLDKKDKLKLFKFKAHHDYFK